MPCTLSVYVLFTHGSMRGLARFACSAVRTLPEVPEHAPIEGSSHGRWAGALPAGAGACARVRVRTRFKVSVWGAPPRRETHLQNADALAHPNG